MSDPLHYDYAESLRNGTSLTDDELSNRTQALIDAARNISLELTLQTERLASTIDKFNREVIEPMRSLKGERDE